MWGTNVYKIQVGGDTKEYVTSRFDSIFQKYLDKKITFSVYSNLYGISAKDLGITFKTDNLVDLIFQVGHSGNFRKTHS